MKLNLSSFKDDKEALDYVIAAYGRLAWDKKVQELRMEEDREELRGHIRAALDLLDRYSGSASERSSNREDVKKILQLIKRPEASDFSLVLAKNLSENPILAQDILELLSAVMRLFPSSNIAVEIAVDERTGWLNHILFVVNDSGATREQQVDFLREYFWNKPIHQTKVNIEFS